MVSNSNRPPQNYATAAYILSRRDWNQDGVLNASEFKLAGDRWSRVDADHNGLVTESELASALSRLEPGSLTRIERHMDLRKRTKTMTFVTMGVLVATIASLFVPGSRALGNVLMAVGCGIAGLIELAIVGTHLAGGLYGRREAEIRKDLGMAPTN